MRIFSPDKCLVNVGQQFGRLTAIGAEFGLPIGPAGYWHRFVVVKCRCGKIKVVKSNSMRSGCTASCGCLVSEAISKRNTTHGLSKHPLNKVFRGMIERCECATDDGFRLYGARGIKIVDCWRRDFMAFYNWAMASGYRKGLSLDRINNDGNYEPDNCRWATPKQQGNNTRRTKHVTAFNETKTLAEWSIDARCAVEYETLRKRIECGWEHEKAIAEKYCKTLLI